MNYLRKDIEDKAIIWFEASNEYLIFEQKTADIIESILNHQSLESIGEQVAMDLDVPYEKAIDFVIDISENVVKKHNQLKTQRNSGYQYKSFKKAYQHQKFYHIKDTVIRIDYESDFELDLIHPKFGHLETSEKQKVEMHLQLFTDSGHTFLLKNGVYFKDWSRKDIHFLQGKVSMLLVQEVYEMEENRWMGVFHASALSDDRNTLLFLGDSGHGKSTSLALLQGLKYNCVADDFVPVGLNEKVYPFPSAISVKHTSWDMLATYYPHLNSQKDYHFHSHNKTVKYLAPKQQNFDSILSCEKLVFIRYYKDIETLFQPMTKLEAFERLLPDSWISPIPENVSVFLEWFSKLNCFSLTYSNNEEMFQIVDKLFQNDL